MNKLKIALPVLLSIAAAVGLYAAQAEKPKPSPRFTGLGDLAGGIELSVANAISADGKVVVGYSHSEQGTEAFRWTSDEGLEGLGFPLAFATSADGSVVVGHRLRDGRSEPVCWTSADGIACPDGLRKYRRGAAQGVSADGTLVVGVVGSGMSSGEGRDEAFLWRRDQSFAPLAGTQEEAFHSDARAISADGRVIVGVRRQFTGHAEAFRWTSDDGFAGLGSLPGHTTSYATAVSADGTVIVGNSSDYTTTTAFRWTAESGMVALGHLDATTGGDGGECDNLAQAISADGRVVVGVQMSRRGREAFVWDAEHGMRRVRDLLAREFAKDGPLALWRLSMATAVSGDGSVVAGVGMNPQGEREAWVARLTDSAEGGERRAGQKLLAVSRMN